MHWKVAQYTFDGERGIVRTEKDEILLEPKATALLAYFCANSHRDLSRDELIQKVWHGHVVSDNAINRIIVQLRKALGDEHKPRRFISTIPKIGYRFISDVQLIDSELSAQESITTSSDWRKWVITGFGLLALLSIVFFLKQQQKNTFINAASTIEPVSRQSGWQFDADLSPDQTKLVYSISEDRGNILYLQNLETGQIEQVSPDTGRAYGGRWSHNGDYFVYIYHAENRCEFHRVRIGVGQATAYEQLQKCNLNSDTNFALSLDDEILYFVERKNSFSPYEVFALDMQEQQRWRLAQPFATSYGNHYLDVHTVTGKVLLLNEPKPGESTLYELNVPENSYKQIKAFDYDLYSAIWGHHNNTVVHPAEHPSYQLLETDLITGKSTVLVSDSRRISTPRRILNDKDYLFASYLYNRDIEIEGQSHSGINSAVMDYLPELSNAGEQLAFVSKRAGHSELWLYDLPSQKLISLESHDKGVTFYNLAWSDNDERIVANTSKGLVVYDLTAQTVVKVLELEQLTYGVDWYADNTLSFSQYRDEQWQAYVWDIEKDTKEKINSETAFVLTDEGKHLLLDKTFRAFAGDREYDISQCARLLFRFQFNFKFEQGLVYCRDKDNVNHLLRISLGSPVQVVSDEFSEVEFYSISRGKIAKTLVGSASSDVMRTRIE